MASRNYTRLRKILKSSGISAELIAVLEPVTKNLGTMADKLEEMQEIIKSEPAISEYDNGGGQKGMKENPAYRAYESLWKSYLSGMTVLIKMFDDSKNKTEEKNDSSTALRLILNKHKNAV